MNLPSLLAGPILRRVERKAIYLWVAMSKRYQVSAQVYMVRNNGKDYTLLSNQSETKTIQLGKKLFISLIKAFPEEDSFPSQTLLGYNLTFSRGNEELDLQDFDLLRKDSPNSIVPPNTLYQFTSSPMKNMSFNYFTDFLLENIIRLYSFINQNEEINRICDESYHLKFEDKHTPSACLLKETIRYLPLENHSIIYTDNNLGLLTISSKTIQNTLLTSNASDKKEIQYRMK